MNTGKRKVMFSCSMKDKVEEKGKWPCGVCKKGADNNYLRAIGRKVLWSSACVCLCALPARRFVSRSDTAVYISILCHGCKKWIHKRYSGVKGNLCNASQSFIWRCCKADSPITDGLNTDLHLDVGNGVSLKKVDKFCYLGDMLDADGGCDSAVTTSQNCLEKVL